MAGLTLNRVTKRFGDAAAVDGVSLEVADGEFLAVLGASGCGKTTLLRLIAGFETVSEGEVRVGEKLLSSRFAHVPPEDRRMGIVFQSYALWPHMTVAGNVAYALKVQGVSGAERDARVAAALATVGLTGFEDRRPALLSGGQRQRVALARCLAMDPALVLLDEPLANLDVHLRASMQDEFAAFHRRAGKTMLYITHDQAEAMALADRIAVMDKGRMLQVAPPSTLYREPATETVAAFVGEGLVMPATLASDPQDGRCEVSLFGAAFPARCRLDAPVCRDVRICVRPQAIMPIEEEESGLKARISRLVYHGGLYRAEAVLDAAPGTRLRFDLSEPLAFNEGDAIRLRIDDSWIIPDQAVA